MAILGGWRAAKKGNATGAKPVDYGRIRPGGHNQRGQRPFRCCDLRLANQLPPRPKLFNDIWILSPANTYTVAAGEYRSTKFLNPVGFEAKLNPSLRSSMGKPKSVLQVVALVR